MKAEHEPGPEASPSSDTAAISIDTAASLAGCEVATVERMIACGLVAEPPLTRKSVTAIRFLLTLEQSGIALDRVVEAVASGALSTGYWDNLAPQPVVLSGRRFGAVLDELELDADIASRLLLAAGLPPVDLARAAREDEVRLLEILARALQLGVSEEAGARLLRVFHHSMRRAAEAMRDVFRSQVEARLLASGVPLAELMAAAGQHRLPLQDLGMATANLLLNRKTEEVVFENVAMRIEAAMHACGAMPRPTTAPPAVAFADLVGFTSFTQTEGDERAASVAAAFEAFAFASLPRFNGRIIKSLGDGLLIYFAGSSSAAGCCQHLIDHHTAHDLPPLRIGVTAGPVLFRDGDIFGATVNRAARLATVAEANEIIGDGAIAAVPCAPGCRWAAHGTATLKGLDDIEVYRLATRA